MTTSTTVKRLSIYELAARKERGERFAVLTAYDYATARLVDQAGIPAILVGDSLGVVVLGYPDTLSVTLDDMVRHTQAVMRGTKHAIVIADMPFMSYQVSIEDAVRNAGRLIKETGAQAVKLEGGQHIAPTIRRLVEIGIPVMAHIGLTPQSINQLGGNRVQGRSTSAAQKLLDDAFAIQDAGAFSVVIEGVPAPLAERISTELTIPTIGIGAGAGCDGQVQVLYDMLGLFEDFTPRHTKHYAELAATIRAATDDYCREVRERAFPSAKESFSMDQSLVDELHYGPSSSAAERA